MLFILFFLFIILIAVIGYRQIVRGDWYTQRAVSQQTRDIPIEAKRGAIYDRKGKELANSISKYTVWAKKSEIKNIRETAGQLSKIIKEDENSIYEILSKKGNSIVKVKRWIDADVAKKLKESNIPGIWSIKDNKRYYPYTNFASYIIGNVSSENTGASGIELQYDEILRGLPGRELMSTDVYGRQTPFNSLQYNKAKDGKGIVLTIDETIQHYAEVAIDNALKVNMAKRAYAIVMDVKNGDILAMVSKPDYNLNEPTKAAAPLFEQELASYSDKDKIMGLYQMWRNPVVNDAYEPGSTFKLLVAAAALEEGLVTPDEIFYCKGYIDVADAKLKCAIYPRSHGRETFTQAVANSCNPVFVEIGQRLGIDRLYDYIQGFGITRRTGIDLPGEGIGQIYEKNKVGPVELGTMSFGQSIAITPIQLITAVSAIANEGKLMKPKIVKELVDYKGKISEQYKSQTIRQVISTRTSKKMMKIMESVVTDGAGKEGYIPGYHVGGKTATAQKVIDGKYQKGFYISSFIGVAPTNDPRLAILVVIDEPKGANHFGGAIAAPVVKDILYNTLRYLNIKPSYTEEEKKNLVKEETIVPEVRNLKLEEAGKILLENNLNYTVETSGNNDANAIILDMFPKPSEKVPKNSSIILYTKNNDTDQNVVVADMLGKTIKEVSNILHGLNLNLKTIGNGKAINQNPAPNSVIPIKSLVTVEFK